MPYRKGGLDFLSLLFKLRHTCPNNDCKEDRKNFCEFPYRLLMKTLTQSKVPSKKVEPFLNYNQVMKVLQTILNT
jgi:hypothetical protein